MARYSDSNGKDRRRYNNSNGMHRPLTPSLGWNGRREVVVPVRPDNQKRKVPDEMFTLRGYKAWAAKVRESWDPET